jgi:hypothetical protein
MMLLLARPWTAFDPELEIRLGGPHLAQQAANLKFYYTRPS